MHSHFFSELFSKGTLVPMTFDRIRDSDETYVFEVHATADLKKLEEDGIKTEDNVTGVESVRERQHRFKLDLATRTQLQRGNEWQNAIQGCSKQRTQFCAVFNPKRATVADRTEFCHKMVETTELCLREMDKAGNKRAREEESASQEEQTTSSDGDASAAVCFGKENSVGKSLFDCQPTKDMATSLDLLERT